MRVRATRVGVKAVPGHLNYLAIKRNVNFMSRINYLRFPTHLWKRSPRSVLARAPLNVTHFVIEFRETIRDRINLIARPVFGEFPKSTSRTKQRVILSERNFVTGDFRVWR